MKKICKFFARIYWAYEKEDAHTKKKLAAEERVRFLEMLLVSTKTKVYSDIVQSEIARIEFSRRTEEQQLAAIADIAKVK